MSNIPALDTRGHLSNSGGLRGHSIGAQYPWTIIGVGYEGWQAYHCETGQRLGPVGTYEEAERRISDATAEEPTDALPANATAYELQAAVAEHNLKREPSSTYPVGSIHRYTPDGIGDPSLTLTTTVGKLVRITHVWGDGFPYQYTIERLEDESEFCTLVRHTELVPQS